MKVYTEVNYEFKNGVLVEQSSKSYEYTGEVSLCGGGSSNMTKMIKTAVVDPIVKKSGELDPTGIVSGKGPKGTLGEITDKVYGGSFKELVEGAQGKDPDAEPVAAPVLSAEEVDPQAALTAQNKKRQEMAGRGAANLTAGQSATMLTS